MEATQPNYVCLEQHTGTRWDKHEPGPTFFTVHGKGTICACRRCGVMFWQPPEPERSLEDGRCQGRTQRGKRCKLDAEYGGFCGHHQDQKPPISGDL